MKAKYNASPKAPAPPAVLHCFVELAGGLVIEIDLPNDGQLFTPRLQAICKREYPAHPFITWWMVDLD